MIDQIFKNGNRRVARLTVAKLVWGIVVLCLIQIQGSMSQLDSVLSEETQTILSFILGVILTCSKGAEMFFDKTVSMFKNHEITSEDTVIITKNETTNNTIT